MAVDDRRGHVCELVAVVLGVLAQHLERLGGDRAVAGHQDALRPGRVRVRVLIVDDDPAMRALCSINLRLDGLDVLEAADGRGALARAERPDLVFTDVTMPRLDGFELAAALRSDEQTRLIPLVFLRGKTSVAGRDRALSLGALAYVTKPFDPSIFASVVADALANAGKHERPAPPQRVTWPSEV